ncbi:DUF6941 family protein [Microbacterium aquimaris]|uniref:Uncharacterized protein n=1 Tax=Microbacterium aquimaris TaxID=459816 RepID=A0ABU5N7D4_9MICO|nr:hypothetical protein [Microbacterium aquimaris]MDZ8161990.1 hypothetical protein [Microbacterium aquimaris]
MFDLATAASTRGGLTTVVDGGFNVVEADTYPTSLDLRLALAIEVDLDGSVADVDVRLAVTTEDGESVGVEDFRRTSRVEIETTEYGEQTTQGASVIIPMPIDTTNLMIPAPGRYRFTLYDGEKEVSFIRLFAELAEKVDSDSHT